MRELIELLDDNLDADSLYNAWKGGSLEIPERLPEVSQ